MAKWTRMNNGALINLDMISHICAGEYCCRDGENILRDQYVVTYTPPVGGDFVELFETEREAKDRVEELWDYISESK